MSVPTPYFFADYDPIGNRFLVVLQESAIPEIHVTLNWFEELKARVSAR